MSKKINGAREVPHDIDAEACVLSAMMIESTAIAKAVEILNETHFYKAAHRTIFKYMIALFENNIEVDLITIIHKLEEKGEIDHIGGRAYLNEISDVVLSYQNIEYHANIVYEKAMLRNLITASSEILQACYESNNSVRETVDWAEQKIFEIANQQNTKSFVSIDEAAPKTEEHIKVVSTENTSTVGIPTGFHILDKKLGGLHKGQLIIIAARTGMGKSALAVNLAFNAAYYFKKKVGIFTLEMATKEIMLRILSSHTELPMDLLHKGIGMTEEILNRAIRTLQDIRKIPIFIDDKSGNTTLDIKAKARRLKADIKGLDLIVIDYLQLITSRKKVENRNQELSEITRALKLMAKDLDVPVICLSQLSRAVENRDNKRPRLSDLRESGAIEQDADVVMFIYREKYYKPNSEYNDKDADIIIAKNRHGAVGTIKVEFIPEFTKFQDKKCM